jgi:hypothetical protein
LGDEQLNREQKKLLDDWFKENENALGDGITFFRWDECSLFPLSLYKRLEKLNDYYSLCKDIDDYIVNKKNECLVSPEKMHCWHASAPVVLYPSNGTNEITELCCWCGKTNTYKMVNSFSSSYPTKEHGPYFQIYKI